MLLLLRMGLMRCSRSFSIHGARSCDALPKSALSSWDITACIWGLTVYFSRCVRIWRYNKTHLLLSSNPVVFSLRHLISSVECLSPTLLLFSVRSSPWLQTSYCSQPVFCLPSVRHSVLSSRYFKSTLSEGVLSGNSRC